MAERRSQVLANGSVVHAVFSDRGDGDLSRSVSDPAELEARRRQLAPVPWTWLTQVHGADVVEVHGPGDRAGERADACVTRCEGATLSVQVADCAPVLLFGPAGDATVVAAAHAGWRGLLLGVIPATVGSMKDLGATEISWWLGPCISAEAYEFSEADLDHISSHLGPGIRALTAAGAPALDLVAAVDASMAASGVAARRIGPRPACTATGGSHWSHRAREDAQRQIGAIWWEHAR